MPSVHETSFVGVSTMAMERRSVEEFMVFLTIHHFCGIETS